MEQIWVIFASETKTQKHLSLLSILILGKFYGHWHFYFVSFKGNCLLSSVVICMSA